MPAEMDKAELMRMSAQIVSSYLSHNNVAAADVPALIETVGQAMRKLGDEPEDEVPEVEPAPQKPAVPIRKSVNPDYIVCLEDGKKLKMLKRHLRTVYGMTPEQYRQKWNLPADYPMVAPNYAAKRSDFAKSIGLGQRPGSRGRGRRAA